jgi:hypothetical protein
LSGDTWIDLCSKGVVLCTPNIDNFIIYCLFDVDIQHTKKTVEEGYGEYEKLACW